jgi:hypothetical protein
MSNPLDNKPSLQWLTLWLSIIVELFTATVGVMLVLKMDDKLLPYEIFCYTTYPRIAIFILCSVLIAGKAFWCYYLKIDVILVGGIGSAISFIFMLIENPDVPNDHPSGLTVHASVMYCAIIFCLIGNYRVLLRWYPWTVTKLWLYKLVRFYACVFFLVQQVVARQVSISAAIAFFAATMALLSGMMAAVVVKEREVMKLELDRKKQNNTKLDNLISNKV